MLELVFVIVVIGIIAAAIMPSTKSNTLQEAALQVASHIRYTQHLAMMDDKFYSDPANSNWYKDRWQIHFSNTEASGNKWAYSIYSDFTGDSTGNPNGDEIAVNPLDRSKVLTGGYSSAGKISKELIIGNKYSIEDVDFIGGCTIADDKQRIFFDHYGRPFYGGPHSQTAPYKDEASVKLLKDICSIELCSTTCTSASSSEKVTIKIEPETGYTYIE